MTQYANDAVNVAPHLHTVLFEDDKLRVLKVRVEPNQSAAIHWHPRNINYILSGGKLRFGKEDGTTIDVKLTTGQVTSSLAGSHSVQNIGTTTVETVQVEMKKYLTPQQSYP